MNRGAYPDRGAEAVWGSPIALLAGHGEVPLRTSVRLAGARPTSGGSTEKMRRLSLTPKLMASLAVVGAAASIAGLGTFATFTSSTSAQNQALTSGTVSITIGAANRLAVGASNL